MPEVLIPQERADGQHQRAGLELYTINIGPKGGPILRWHPHNVSGEPVTIPFQGHVYEWWPAQVKDLEVTQSLPQPSPKLIASDIDRRVTILMQQWGDLQGCIVTLIKCFFEDTDGRPGANPFGSFPVYEFVIDDVASDEQEQVAFNLRPYIDAKGQRAPKATISATICDHEFRNQNTCQADTPELFNLKDELIPWTVDRGLYSPAASYATGDKVRMDITPDNFYPWEPYVVPCFFVAKSNVSAGHTPLFYPNFWEGDYCARLKTSCECRFGVGNVLNTSAKPGTFNMG